jgi:deoxyribodipyrimidine photo-lyase
VVLVDALTGVTVPMTAATDCSLVWFRHDLRLADNPALAAAVERQRPVVCVYVWEPDEERPWPPGAASRWWLHHSLGRLDEALRSAGSQLVIRRGPTTDGLRSLCAEVRASAVFWNRRYEPSIIQRDKRVASALQSEGESVETFNGNLLHEPWEVRTREERAYQVFTPYWRACGALPAPTAPLRAPERIPAPAKWPASVALDELGLLPKIPWDAGLRASWAPGESGAQALFSEFIANGLAGYREERNRPDRPGSSRLSPHLHFGEISPRQIWHAVRRQRSRGAETFLTEIGWREFAHHVLYHFPHTPEAPLREPFRRFPWVSNRRAFRAWQQGQTGYPIVDAGLRELWTTGWMHNRVRMIAGSFLTKDLLISWREGSRWFWDTLVDADLANNTLGWQWVSGCGADAAPYFRVFNPVSQAEKFDPEGAYVRHWVPELARVPDRWIHRPWSAPVDVLNAAAVRLGATYPRPIVNHEEARRAALSAWETIKRPT